MKKIKMYFFKLGRKISLFRKMNRGIFFEKILRAVDGNAKITTLLRNEKPCLIARIGSSEMQAINETICVDLGIKKEINQKVKDILYTNAGFFPNSDSAVKKFTDIYCDGGKKVDLLAVLGNSDEDFFIEEYCKNAELTNLCALESMLEDIKNIDFDIAIIECGAYSFPIGCEIKKMGKKEITMGGVTQILFGIKGARWDKHPIISELYNDNWCRAESTERPDQFQKVEGSCYW